MMSIKIKNFVVCTFTALILVGCVSTNNNINVSSDNSNSIDCSSTSELKESFVSSAPLILSDIKNADEKIEKFFGDDVEYIPRNKEEDLLYQALLHFDWFTSINKPVINNSDSYSSEYAVSLADIDGDGAKEMCISAGNYRDIYANDIFKYADGKINYLGGYNGIIVDPESPQSNSTYTPIYQNDVEDRIVFTYTDWTYGGVCAETISMVNLSTMSSIPLVGKKYYYDNSNSPFLYFTFSGITDPKSVFYHTFYEPNDEHGGIEEVSEDVYNKELEEFISCLQKIDNLSFDNTSGYNGANLPDWKFRKDVDYNLDEILILKETLKAKETTVKRLSGEICRAYFKDSQR